MFAVPGLLDEFEVALDRACGTDVGELSPLQTEAAVLTLERCKAKVAALEGRLLRKFEADQAWKRVGALKPQAYLGARFRVPSATFNRQCSVARRQRDLPAIEVALASGAISVAHRDTILAVDSPRVHDALVAEQDTIVGWASRLPWKDFEHELAAWVEQHDQDGAEPDETERNRLDLSQTFGGRWRFDADLDPIGGAIAAKELERLERLEFERDWAEAKARLGREPNTHELGRTPKQRRAAAFIEMARRSATGPEESRRGRIVLSIFTGLDAMRRMMEADTGTVLRPQQVAPWLDDHTWFETFVFDTEFREITVSQQRNYRGAIRRAVLGRDRQCTHRYCDEPASRCEVDHHQPVSKGGPTTGWNGRGACDGHNRAKSNKDPSELEEGP